VASVMDRGLQLVFDVGRECRADVAVEGDDRFFPVASDVNSHQASRRERTERRARESAALQPSDAGGIALDSASCQVALINRQNFPDSFWQLKRYALI
jgi:hypothetical protein